LLQFYKMLRFWKPWFVPKSGSGIRTRIDTKLAKPKPKMTVDSDKLGYKLHPDRPQR
jgi:hypothetical protein